MHIDFFYFFIKCVYIYIYIYLVLTFDVFNTKNLIIYFFRIIFFLRKTHELLKAKHLRFKVFNS